MDGRIERRLLQAAVALGCLVAIGAGGAGMVTGGTFLRGLSAPLPTDVDSHLRYLSGLLLGIGLAFAACVPAIERRSLPFALLTGLVVTGGLGRLASLLLVETPSAPHVAGLALELGLVPSLFLWQRRVARRTRRSTGDASA